MFPFSVHIIFLHFVEIDNTFLKEFLEINDQLVIKIIEHEIFNRIIKISRQLYVGWKHKYRVTL